MPSSLGAFELELAIEPSQLPSEVRVSVFLTSLDFPKGSLHESSNLLFFLRQDFDP
jgi:hypothetical protein